MGNRAEETYAARIVSVISVRGRVGKVRIQHDRILIMDRFSGPLISPRFENRFRCNKTFPPSPLPMFPPTQSLNILHLEDDSLHSELLKTELEIRGFSYSIARVWTRDAFNAALSNGRIDIIVADWKTAAETSSFDSATALEDARRQSSPAPFVFFAQDMPARARREAFQRGATDFISKSDLPKLVRILNWALYLKQGRTKPSNATPPDPLAI